MNLQSKLNVYFFIFTIFTTFVAGHAAAKNADNSLRLPDCMLSYQFGPKQYVIVVEKSTQSLFVYSNYQSRPLKKFIVTTGKEKGQKHAEGDLKTPEGIYFFRRVLTGNQLPKEDDYGEKAFTMNYPNPIDNLEKRDGSGIWLHGAFDETKTNDPNNSRGCVVLDNQDLLKLSKYILLNQTPIVVYNTITYEGTRKLAQKRERFISYLTSWKTNWENKDIDGYISFYEDGFRDSGRNLRQFKEYKKSLNERYRFIRVFLSDINIYAFNNYHVAVFNQLYVSDVNHFYTKKIQYWRDYSNTAKIADELNVRMPPINKIEISPGKTISIDKFRRDYSHKPQPQPQVPENSLKFIPDTLNLGKITLLDTSVKIWINRSQPGDSLRIIPVLFSKINGEISYITIPGIRLEKGIPQNYDGAYYLEGGSQTGMVTLDKDENANVKSVTLFVVNNDDQVEQIITYFINRSL